MANQIPESLQNALAGFVRDCDDEILQIGNACKYACAYQPETGPSSVHCRFNTQWLESDAEYILKKCRKSMGV